MVHLSAALKCMQLNEHRYTGVSVNYTGLSVSDCSQGGNDILLHVAEHVFCKFRLQTQFEITATAAYNLYIARNRWEINEEIIQWRLIENTFQVLERYIF